MILGCFYGIVFGCSDLLNVWITARVLLMYCACMRLSFVLLLMYSAHMSFPWSLPCNSSNNPPFSISWRKHLDQWRRQQGEGAPGTLGTITLSPTLTLSPPDVPLDGPEPGGGWQKTVAIEGTRNKAGERKFKTSTAFPVRLGYLFSSLLLFVD